MSDNPDGSPFIETRVAQFCYGPPKGRSTEDTTMTDAEIRTTLADAGYRAAQIAGGLAYADAQAQTDGAERFILAVSRILYTDAELEEGARFAVA